MAAARETARVALQNTQKVLFDEQEDPKYRPPNTIILIMGTPKDPKRVHRCPEVYRGGVRVRGYGDKKS